MCEGDRVDLLIEVSEKAYLQKDRISSIANKLSQFQFMLIKK